MMPLNIVPRDTLAAGSVGEFITSSVAEAIGGAQRDVRRSAECAGDRACSSGDWDVFGNVGFTFSTQGAGANAWIGTASAARSR